MTSQKYIWWCQLVRLSEDSWIFSESDPSLESDLFWATLSDLVRMENDYDQEVGEVVNALLNRHPLLHGEGTHVYPLSCNQNY